LSDQGIPISISATGDVIESPIINTTQAQTTVSARSGQTVILGGLITKDRATVDRSVPYLGDIPVLGSLFRYDFIAENRTELLIIMTPYIVRKPEDSDWLLQMEAERMSWCLADVINVHGTDGSFSLLPPDMAQTEVIYPDAQPTVPKAGTPGLQEEIPSPGTGAGATAPWPKDDLTSPPTSGGASLDQTFDTGPITETSERSSVAPVNYLNSAEDGKPRWLTKRSLFSRSR
jgi:hypothetical protein